MRRWFAKGKQGIPPDADKTATPDLPAAFSHHAWSAEEKRFLLGLARKTLVEAAKGGTLPECDPEGLSPSLTANRACFVTLTLDGKLRGCIGNIRPERPLYKAVMENARNAALNDPRFPPLDLDELEGVRIEISILSETRPLEFRSSDDLLRQLVPGETGVLLRVSGRTATFLPQVWSQIPEKVRFMDHLALKAGCSADEWRSADASISVYSVDSFEEPEAADYEI